MITGLLNTLLVICSFLLIFLVLIQRGKGGGLAGAFGGAGGSSAFGTKAGDVFTKVTMYVAGVWIVLSMILGIMGNQGHTSAWGEGPGGTSGVQKVPSKPEKSGSKTSPVPPPPGSSAKQKQGQVDAAQPGQEPAAEKPSSGQPLNPGDPLPPLPPPTPAKGSNDSP